jgi:low affinity Fe/Cu permease
MTHDDVPVPAHLRSSLAKAADAMAGTGSGIASIVAALLVTGWLILGALTGFDEGWHREMHTLGAAVALVMVFVIQYASYRQARAILLKLDELIRSDERARDTIIGVENEPVHRQEQLEQEMRRKAGA